MHFPCVLVQWSFVALFATLLSLHGRKTDSVKSLFSVHGFPIEEGRDTGGLRRAEPCCSPPKHRPVFVAPRTSCSRTVGREQGQNAQLPRIFLHYSPQAEKCRVAPVPTGVPWQVKSVQGSGQYLHQLCEILATRPATFWPMLENKYGEEMKCIFLTSLQLCPAHCLNKTLLYAKEQEQQKALDVNCQGDINDVPFSHTSLSSSLCLPQSASPAFNPRQLHLSNLPHFACIHAR